MGPRAGFSRAWNSATFTSPLNGREENILVFSGQSANPLGADLTGLGRHVRLSHRIHRPTNRFQVKDLLDVG